MEIHFEILPEAQKAIWPHLASLPDQFVLYGGTAIALRLGHRASVDFDFFSSDPLRIDNIYKSVPVLARSEVLQSEQNTLTISVPVAGGAVKLSFFGGISFGRVGEPEATSDGVLHLASLMDLFGTKLKVLLQRIEQKDYLDVAAILDSGLALKDGLGAARTLYGKQFPPMDCARALTYFDEGSAQDLPEVVKQQLRNAVAGWDESVDDMGRRGDRLDAG